MSGTGIDLTETLSAQVRFIPVRVRILKELLNLLKYIGQAFLGQDRIARDDLAQLRRHLNVQLFFFGDDLGGFIRSFKRTGVNRIKRHSSKEQGDRRGLLLPTLGQGPITQRPLVCHTLIQGLPMAHQVDAAPVHQSCFHAISWQTACHAHAGLP